jgi:hypothetical protein
MPTGNRGQAAGISCQPRCESRAVGTLDKYAGLVLHEPHGQTFVNPRSCFNFRFEKANVVLHSVGECNLHAPCRIDLLLYRLELSVSVRLIHMVNMGREGQLR